jgi:hypothetical protein
VPARDLRLSPRLEAAVRAALDTRIGRREPEPTAGRRLPRLSIDGAGFGVELALLVAAWLGEVR